MTKNETMAEIIQYETKGTCCKIMQVKISGGMVQEVDFIGGCPGNLIGIRSLVKNMHIDEVISKFSGIPCGDKPTSCPDQLAQCLMAYKRQKQAAL